MNTPNKQTSGNGKSAAPPPPDVNGNTKVQEPATPEQKAAPVYTKPEPKEPVQQQAAQVTSDDVIKQDGEPVAPKSQANPMPRAEQDGDRSSSR